MTVLNIEGEFNETVKVDPSVQYAEAVMNGEQVVTVTAHNGQQTTYKIGQEYLAHNTYE
ncbi:MAG TPA: hypothetical protein PKI93_04540 [Alphaproteobacteria bacterium]|nr:hypothetical protein [Alphaproteobacteria bacterium]HNS44613.1 hypothetical protein [Alphaproteobacteria bacterium]